MKTEHQMPEFMRNHYTLKAMEVLKKKKATLFFKRLFDICLSLLLLVLLSPVFLVLSICIKLEDGGPIFYRQQRITTFGRVFRIFKFPFTKIFFELLILFDDKLLLIISPEFVNS